MTSSREIVRGIVLAALLASGQSSSAQQPPDGVDYLMAVQCAGLTHAIGVFESYEGFSKPAEERARRFGHWAEMRAIEGGKDPELAKKDVTASQKDFVAQGGKGTNATRLKRLEAAYPGEVKACRMLSDIEDYVIIGG